ncbi:MAG: EAL domain-containing protein [Solibacillus sp.]
MFTNQTLPLSQEYLFSWLKQFSDQYMTGAVIIDLTKEEFPIVYYNELFATLTHYKDGELLGQSISFLNGLKTNSEIEAEIQYHLQNAISEKFTILHYGKNDVIFWNHLKIHLIKDTEQCTCYAFLTCEDYTDQMLNQTLSTLESSIYKQLEQQTTTACILQQIAEQVELTFTRQTKCAIHLVTNHSTYEFIASGSLPPEIVNSYPIIQFNKQMGEQSHRIFLQEFEPRFIEEQQFVIASAWTMPILSTHNALIGAITLFFENSISFKKNEIQFLEALAKLISLSIKYAEQKQQLHQLAYYDSATAIPNMYYFNQVLQQWIEQGTSGFIAILQPGEYSNIVDLYGRHIGDELLSQMVARLQQTNGANNEFVAKFTNSALIIAHQMTIEQIKIYESRINHLTTAPYTLYDKEIYITLKIGVSFFNPESLAEQCVREADLALTKSRATSGTNTAFFNTAITSEIQQEMDVLNQLAYGLEHKEFTVHLQPKINFETLAIEGFEALSRWQSHRLGNVSPAVFIPIAEQAGKINEIDTLVLREVLKWQQNRLANNLKTVPIAVNISPDHFYGQAFTENFLTLLEAYQVPAHYIKFEITESIELVDFKKAKAILMALKNAGIESSIDDFGVGFSSLSYLPQLPFSEIKIDRSFVNAMHDPGMNAVVQTIIQLAKNLQMHAIAEGIETLEQYETLKAMGCPTGQGYYFYKPMPLEEATILLNEKLL